MLLIYKLPERKTSSQIVAALKQSAISLAWRYKELASFDSGCFYIYEVTDKKLKKNGGAYDVKKYTLEKEFDEDNLKIQLVFSVLSGEDGDTFELIEFDYLYESSVTASYESNSSAEKQIDTFFLRLDRELRA